MEISRNSEPIQYNQFTAEKQKLIRLSKVKSRDIMANNAFGYIPEFSTEGKI